MGRVGFRRIYFDSELPEHLRSVGLNYYEKSGTDYFYDTVWAVDGERDANWEKYWAGFESQSASLL